MRSLSFRVDDDLNLRAWLEKPLLRASLQPQLRGGPLSISLWHTDIGVRIASRMHDVGPRMEVGILEFTLTDTPMDGEVFKDIPEEARVICDVEKLVVIEADTACESGVILRSVQQAEIMICAGVAPFSVAIRGLCDDNFFEPEYELWRYRRFPLE